MKDEIVLVAEVGINHNGSIETTKKLIDVAADAGCHFVKFQKRDIESVYTKEELDTPRVSPWGKTNREQKQGLEFSVEQYKEIDAYCKSKNIGWFVSCWDVNSLKLMEENFPDMPFIKIASAMACDEKFLKAVVQTKKNVILSTGMMSPGQIDKAISLLVDNLSYVLHCTSTYPTKPEEMNMSYIKHLRYRCDYKSEDIKVGFSNHYSGLVWVPLAVALGAKMLEFHITLDRTMYGSDQAASLEPEGVKKLVESVRISQLMLGAGDKVVYESEKPIIAKLRKNTDF